MRMRADGTILKAVSRNLTCRKRIRGGNIRKAGVSEPLFPLLNHPRNTTWLYQAGAGWLAGVCACVRTCVGW